MQLGVLKGETSGDRDPNTIHTGLLSSYSQNPSKSQNIKYKQLGTEGEAGKTGRRKKEK